jgi:hypothetical protein
MGSFNEYDLLTDQDEFQILHGDELSLASPPGQSQRLFWITKRRENHFLFAIYRGGRAMIRALKKTIPDRSEIPSDN